MSEREQLQLETVFRVRILPGGRKGRFLLILWLAGMGGMLVGLLLTFGNAIGGAAGLALPMLWIAFKLTKRAEYGVSADGVRETILDPQGKAVGGRDKRFRWDQVESWLIDSDLVRGAGDRRFIELRMNDGYRMRFREANDKPMDPEFTAFAAALESLVSIAPESTQTSTPARRLSFYERPAAKFLTVLFMVLTVGILLAAMLIPQYFGEAAWFRLLVIIIPGTIYMFVRTFGRRRSSLDRR
ncbi:MAG: hypothetical protein O3A20_00560 [Planctomycetota bacterium]|nr:hypothetical protein [Planctomycetota bacterium]